MASPNDHFARTFLTRRVAATPIAITAYLIYLINEYTEWLCPKSPADETSRSSGWCSALVIILTSPGMLANSIIGQSSAPGRSSSGQRAAGAGDLPGLEPIALTPGGTEGTSARSCFCRMRRAG